MEITPKLRISDAAEFVHSSHGVTPL